MNSLSLLQNLMTRVAHDIAGNVSVVQNMAQLLREDRSFWEEGAALLQETGETLKAKLRFFRLILGTEKKENIAQVVKDFLTTFSIPLKMEKEPKNVLQVICLWAGLLLLPRGGKITFLTDSVRFSSVGTGENLFISFFAGKGTKLSPLTAPLFLLQQSATEQGIVLSVEQQSETVQVKFS